MTDPIAGLNAALADHYIIDRELGRGGMAVVYLARDIKHERFVALKTLKPEIAVAVGRDRFLREIRLAARLQHPNILAVYDSGDAAGVLYYVMPYVEGESLRDRLQREPQLPLDDALQIAREVAGALAYAHSHDVVHRDIKPENIMLSGGHAIVTDFGIARAVSAAGGDKLTETGLAIGTPVYMPPEQSAGTGRVDSRSDIYSLACVLYETLAGQPPFTGPTAHAIMARHSLDSVPRLKIVREAIPDDLEAVIDRALEKVPADRYQTAAQFAEALSTASTGTVSRVTAARRRTRGGWRWWRQPVPVVVGVTLLVAAGWLLFGRRGTAGPATSGGLDLRRVAVLYFQDLSPDTSLGYLADGLTEGLIEELRGVRALDVVSRNGVVPFRGEEIARDSIARALNAGTLVEGNVERIAQRVRVTVRLVDGASGADLRRQSFELPAGAQLAMRDSLARQAARFLRERLGDEVRLREQRAGTHSVEAWTLLQQAERLRKEEEGLVRTDSTRALAAFQRADALLVAAEQADPGWVDPIVLRGQVGYIAARATAAPARRASFYRSALAHANRALEVGPGNAPALGLRGTLRYALWRLNLDSDPARRKAALDSAAADLEAAVRADPTLATAHAILSQLYYFQREDVVSAVLAARTAYESDAYLRDAETIVDRLFWGTYDIAQFGEARRWCDEGSRRFAGNWRFAECHLWLLLLPDADRDIDRAWRLAAQADSLTPPLQRPLRERIRKLVVGGVVGRAGLRDSAEHVLSQARTSDPAIDPTQDLPGYEAVMRTLMGDNNGAIGLLKRYVVTHPDHPFRRSGMLHWWWRDLERHPEFHAVLSAER